MRYVEMMTETIASDPRYAAIREQAREGIRVWRGEAVEHRPADPGDFGAGQYFTTFAARARTYAGNDGNTRSIVLRFDNPLVMNVSDAYDLAQHYGTIHGTTDERLAAARQMTKDIQAAGYDGFIGVHPRRMQSYTELEVVQYTADLTFSKYCSCA